MYFFKRQPGRQFVELSIAILVIWAFVANSLVPQTVEAKTFDFGLISRFFTQDNEQIVDDSLSSFPSVSDADPRQVMWVTMTAYSSDVAQTDSTPCIPADASYDLCEHYEEYGEQNTIATNFLPMGTQVRFPDLYGDKVFVVRDRMNARYGRGRGDFWMPERELAKNFGVKRVQNIF